MSADLKPPATTFDLLIERMGRDVDRLEAQDHGPQEATARLQHVLNTAIAEARNKARTIRAAAGVAGAALHEEMSSHPTASISSAFAAGYLIGKRIVGRARR
jgi:hypothetical protein